MGCVGLNHLFQLPTVGRFDRAVLTSGGADQVVARKDSTVTDVTHKGETEKLLNFHAYVLSDDLLQKIPILIINAVQSGLLTELLHIKAWLLRWLCRTRTAVWDSQEAA